MKPFIYVANWKMAMTRQSVQTFMAEFHSDAALYSRPNTTIILCPSFTHIAMVASLLNGTKAKLGGQTCSTYARGAYTGQTSATMLAETGCSYCIIGHSERRTLCDETNEDVAAQYVQLVAASLTPIICIGETASDHTAGTTTSVLEHQLSPLIEAFKQHPSSQLMIAYEPVWAIGTGVTPTIQELAATCSWLKSFISQNFAGATTMLLYGGSVDATNAAEIKTIPSVDGLLIGGASQEFKKFKNIVV